MELGSPVTGSAAADGKTHGGDDQGDAAGRKQTGWFHRGMIYRLMLVSRKYPWAGPDRRGHSIAGKRDATASLLKGRHDNKKRRRTSSSPDACFSRGWREL